MKHHYQRGSVIVSRWDEQEKTRTSGISTFLLAVLMIFTAGFLVGGLWGYYFFESIELTPIPPAFAEEIQHFKITLEDGIGISDTVILSSETFIKP